MTIQQFSLLFWDSVLNHLSVKWFHIFQYLLHIYLVGHEGGEGASDLVVVHVGLTWAEQDEKKANGNGDLEHRLQEDGVAQPDEGHGGLLQELNAALTQSTSAL